MNQYHIIKHNPIDNILSPYYNTDDELIILIHKLYKFIQFYSKEKIKALIMNYVWVHIRQPKIEEKYSPQNLIKELKENGNDMDALDIW